MSVHALATRTIDESTHKAITFAVLVLFGVCLLSLSAKIQVPFIPVPMTLQGLAVAGLAAAYGLRLGLSTIVAYLAAGYMGAPVFAGFVAGPAYFVGPTAGFLAGFVVLTVIVGYVADRVNSEDRFALFIAMLVGDAMLFLLGFIWLGYFFTTADGNLLGGNFAWEKGVEPFILGDVVKMTLASLLVPALSRLMRK